MLFNTRFLHECEGKVLTSQAETNYLKSRKPKKTNLKDNDKRENLLLQILFS